MYFTRVRYSYFPGSGVVIRNNIALARCPTRVFKNYCKLYAEILVIIEMSIGKATPISDFHTRVFETRWAYITVVYKFNFVLQILGIFNLLVCIIYKYIYKASQTFHRRSRIQMWNVSIAPKIHTTLMFALLRDFTDSVKHNIQVDSVCDLKRRTARVQELTRRICRRRDAKTNTAAKRRINCTNCNIIKYR